MRQHSLSVVATTAVATGLGALVSVGPIFGLAAIAAMGALLVSHVFVVPIALVLLSTVAVIFSTPTAAAIIVALLPFGLWKPAFGRELTGAPRRILCLYTGWLALSLIWTDLSWKHGLIGLAPHLVALIVALGDPSRSRSIPRWIVFMGTAQSVLALGAFVIASGARITTLALFAAPMPAVAAPLVARAALAPREGYRALHGALFAINVMGTLVTETRGMAAGMAVGIALVVLSAQSRSDSISRWRRSSRRAAMVLGGVVMLAVGVAMVFRTNPRASYRLSPDSLLMDGTNRFAETGRGLTEFGAAPVAGHGIGHTFENAFAGGADIVNYVHNVWVYQGIVGGLVGLGLFIALVCTVWKRLGGLAPEDAWGMRASLLALLLYASTSAIQRTVHYNVLLGLFVLSVSGSRPTRDGASAASHRTANRRVDGRKGPP